MYPKVVSLAFFAHFDPLNPLKSPLYRELSTSKGLYSSKSLHKLVLQETVLIFQCYEMEIFLVVLFSGVFWENMSRLKYFVGSIRGI